MLSEFHPNQSHSSFTEYPRFAITVAVQLSKCLNCAYRFWCATLGVYNPPFALAFSLRLARLRHVDPQYSGLCAACRSVTSKRSAHSVQTIWDVIFGRCWRCRSLCAAFLHTTLQYILFGLSLPNHVSQWWQIPEPLLYFMVFSLWSWRVGHNLSITFSRGLCNAKLWPLAVAAMLT